MKIKQFTISQTFQVKQFEPLNTQVTFEVEGTEDSIVMMRRAHHFVFNSLRAEYYRQLMVITSVTDKDKVSYEDFIQRHIHYDYFGTGTKKRTFDL